MQVKIRLPAPPGERFSDQAAAAMVCQRPAFNLREYDGGPILRDLGQYGAIDPPGEARPTAEVTP